MEKKYDEDFETKKQVIKLISGKYSKRLLEEFEKSPEAKCEFDGYWPLDIEKSTYHLLTETLVFEPELTKRLHSFLRNNYFSEDYQKHWIEKTYPNSEIMDLSVDNVDYPFFGMLFSPDDSQGDLLYAEPLYIIIRRGTTTPKLFRIEVQGAMGENGAYFMMAINNDEISCENGDFIIESTDNGEYCFKNGNLLDEPTEEEQESISKGICPKCGGKLSYYPTFTF